MLTFAIGLVVGAVIGVLVGRANKNKVEKALVEAREALEKAKAKF